MTQEAMKGGGTTGGGTGTVCGKTGLYKATDGKIEFIVYWAVGDIFGYFPGGNRSKKCTWTYLTLAADGGKTSFTAVKVAAGVA